MKAARIMLLRPQKRAKQLIRAILNFLASKGTIFGINYKVAPLTFTEESLVLPGLLGFVMLVDTLGPGIKLHSFPLKNSSPAKANNLLT